MLEGAEHYNLVYEQKNEQIIKKSNCMVIATLRWGYQAAL